MTVQLKVFVVSNAEQSAELCAHLRAAGIQHLEVGDGSDETLAHFRSFRPHVVVVAAGLNKGDARALINAMRSEAGEGGVAMVLVGETDGPVRTALDAEEFGVQRFVGRPVSKRALVYAVRSSAETVLGADPESAPLQPTAIVAPDPRPITEADERGAGSAADPAEAAEIGAGGAASSATTGGAVADSVRDAVVNAIAASEEHDAPGESVRSANEGAFRDGQEQGKTEQPENARPRRTPRGARLDTDGIDEMARADTVAVDVSGDALEMKPVREPTLVLHEDDRGDAAARPAASAGDAAPASQTPAAGLEMDVSGGEFTDESWSKPDMVVLRPVPDDDAAAFSDDDDLNADLPENLADGFDVGLDEDLAEELGANLDDVPDASVMLDQANEPAIASEPGTEGGEFARELRSKMSEMAERLFPGGPVDDEAGQAESNQPDEAIDIASIDIDAIAALEAEPSAYANLGTQKTFISDVAVTTPKYPNKPRHAAAEEPEQIQLRERGEVSADDSDIASLLARLYAADFSGEVVFRKRPAEKVVFFESGRPIFATSNLPNDRMGAQLYREGKLTKEQYQRSRGLVAESGRRMGEILIEMGFLKRRELLPAVRRHIEDIIYSLFAWREGDYVVRGGTGGGLSDSSEKIRLARHPVALIFEGVRRKYDQAVIEHRLGSASAIIATSERDRVNQALSVADLNDEERAVIEMFDGDHDLGQIARATGASLLIVYQLAFALVLVRAAEIYRRGEDTQAGLRMSRSPALVGESDVAIDRQRILAKHSLVEDADYFTLLGVRRDASAFEVRRAFEAAQRDYAVDNFPDALRDELYDQISAINTLIEEAFEVLRDEELRESYLSNLRG